MRPTQFVPEDGPRVRGEGRVAFVRELGGASEGVVVEALRALASDPDPECGLTLAALLAEIPEQKLGLILAENLKHRFLSESQTRTVLQALPTARLRSLALCLGESAAAVLGADGTLGLLKDASDEQLWALWERAPELVLRSASESVLERLLGVALAGQELMAGMRSRVQPILAAASRRLDNGRLWQLLSALVRRQPADARAAVFEEALRFVEPERVARMVAERFDDDEVRVYWVLFPRDVREVLVGMGRGPVWQTIRPNASSSSQNRRRSRGERSARAASGRQTASHPDRELQTALRLMQGFGFRESMSYEQARHRYRQLAYAWHPDRAGSDPSLARKIRDLNSAWQVARVHFASAC